MGIDVTRRRLLHIEVTLALELVAHVNLLLMHESLTLETAVVLSISQKKKKSLTKRIKKNIFFYFIILWRAEM